MRRLLWTALLVAALACAARAQEEDTPHTMLKPNGEADMEKCAVCHTEDMSLVAPKSEICLTCHTSTLHAGAAQHLAASAESVTRVLEARKEKEPQLPLTDEGQLYCGTCHVFHDPRLSEEKILSAPGLPPKTKLSLAVREALPALFQALAEKYGEKESGAKFDDKGTRRLRLPVKDGALCRHCHGGGGR
jgi:hypothetical protein